MTILGFFLGALAHLTMVVSDWVGERRKERAYLDYFREYHDIAIKGAIGDVVLFVAWESGAIGWILASTSIAIPALPPFSDGLGFGVAFLAGYAADSAGKRIYRKWRRRWNGGVK